MLQPTPTVFVVDDDSSVRESLELLILEAGWRPETFESGETFLAHPRTPSPSCLVLGIHLPGLNGLDLQRLLADRAETPIIFITGYADVPTTVQAMKGGAFEFLTKPISDDMLLNVVRRALDHSKVLLGREAEYRELRDRYASLSRREQEVMTLVVSGLLNKQVGGELGISEITVKAHRGRIMRKMEANSFAALVNMAVGLQLTDMKTSRFSEEQIIGFLKQAEARMPVKELYGKDGFNGMDAADAKRLRELEAENRKLRKLLAEAHLDLQALKGGLGLSKCLSVNSDVH